jgi:excisionase family DNA binding protein
MARIPGESILQANWIIQKEGSDEIRPPHSRIKEIRLIFNLFPGMGQKGERKMAESMGRGWGRGRVVTSALLTVPEAAKYLGVGRKKTYELIEWGELKAVKLGRSVQVERDSLDRLRESGRLT